MNKDLKTLIEMYENIIAILKIYQKNQTYDLFINNKRAVIFVMNKLKKIGNLSQNLSDEVKKSYYNIPWDRILMLKEVDRRVHLSLIYQLYGKL